MASEMGSKNPKDLIKEFKTVNGTVTTLLAKPEFFPAWTSNDDQPYRVYDKSFSRLAVTIIQKPAGGGKLVVTANIPVDELAGIYKRADNASMLGTVLASGTCQWIIGTLKKLSTPKTSAPQGEDSRRAAAIEAAQGVRIANGALKGMTPYQAAAEGKIQLLERQVAWLTDNLEKYPKNKIQINAINAALYLVKNSLLDAAGQGSGAAQQGPEVQETITLLAAVPKGNSRKEDNLGRCPCQETEILWHVGNRYPVEVRITNYKAPIRKDEAGRQNVVRSERQEELQLVFRLDESSFWNDCRMVKTHMERFEQLYAFNQFGDADMQENNNRKKAGYEARG